MTTPLIEAIARAMDATCGYAGDDNVRRAKAALTAISEAGYVVLERVPVPDGMDEVLYRAQLASFDEVVPPISAAQGDG